MESQVQIIYRVYLISLYKAYVYRPASITLTLSTPCKEIHRNGKH
jgi:hypothetical protein